ncbi:MAG: chemotaxis protein CheW [Methylotenera sp.]|uniref:chemotaxis protein CheW n=1 Tax=Methylotenera sp. TaxID=2051956 RepID=UPI00271C6AF5|nr:chemotaxis protein CheW [Methylotenera sp.]MDO9150240.1 chemotaxis protein CheW [Methylotenera sp.]
MAQTSNLREFQEAILAKLKDAANQVGGESSSRLGVTVGNKRFLINLQDVKEVLPVPPLQSVPFTKVWFLGVANVRGNLYSISDLAQFMGMPATSKSVNNRILLLSTESTEQVALLVDSLIGLRSIQTMQAQTIEDASSLYSVNGFIDTEGNDWLELDIEALVQNKSFVQPTH